MNPLSLEKKENPPILIIDKEGLIGERVAYKLSSEAQVVLVSEKEKDFGKNIIRVPFENTNPLIPNSFYSHIIIINPQDVKEALPSFLKKANDDRAIFVVASHYKNLGWIIREGLQDFRLAKLIFFGDVFGPESLKQKTPSLVNRFINQARIRGRIDVPGDGTDLTYPVFVDDLIDGILETSFGSAGDKIFYLFPKHGVTSLNLASLIQRSDPMVKIDFTGQEEVEKPDATLDGVFILPEKYDLEKRISGLDIKGGAFKKSEAIIDLEKRKSTNPFRIVLFTFLFFLFLPVFSTLVFALLGQLFLGSAKTSIFTGRPTLSLSSTFFGLASQTNKVLGFETSFFPLPVSRNLDLAIENGIRETTGIGEFYKGETDLFSGNAKEGLSHISAFLLFEQSQKATTGEYSGVDEELFSTISSTFDAWPQILGIGGTKKYLLTFTNNLKASPGGGEIEAFAILGLTDGKLIEFNVQKTSDSDKKLKGHVEPPFPLRRYLLKPNLFLKDSNFSPDFRQSASSSAFFVNTEEAETIDGVFSIDLNFVQDLIRTSPLFIKPQNVEVNPKNIFDFAKEHENDEDFFVQLLSELKSKIESNPEILFSNITKELGNKNLVFASSDSKTQSIFDLNNFSGGLWDDREIKQNLFNDFLGLSEYNLGKAINFSKRADAKVAVADDGTLSENLTVQYEGGTEDEKVYLEVILPNQINLEKVKVNGEDKDITDAITDPNKYEAKDFQAPKGLEIEKNTVAGKSVFGLVVDIPKNKTTTLELDYLSPVKIQTNADFSYSVRLFKSLGASPYPLNFSLSFPKTFSTNTSTNSQKSEGEISLSRTVDKDYDLSFNFLKK